MNRAINSRPRVGKRYLQLFGQFPIRPIRSDGEYEAALAVLDPLAIRDEGSLSHDEQDYLEALTLVVSAYDDKHHRIDTSNVTPRRLVRHLMQERGMSASDLGLVLGSKSAATFILNGSRVPSRTQCFKLARYFGLDPGAFLAAPKVRARQAG